MSWRQFLRRRYWDEQWAREPEAYLGAEPDENIARSMSPEEVQHAVRRNPLPSGQRLAGVLLEDNLPTEAQQVIKCVPGNHSPTRWILGGHQQIGGNVPNCFCEGSPVSQNFLYLIGGVTFENNLPDFGKYFLETPAVAPKPCR
jgi:hypothetical protein